MRTMYNAACSCTVPLRSTLAFGKRFLSDAGPARRVARRFAPSCSPFRGPLLSLRAAASQISRGFSAGFSVRGLTGSHAWSHAGRRERAIFGAKHPPAGSPRRGPRFCVHNVEPVELCDPRIGISSSLHKVTDRGGPRSLPPNAETSRRCAPRRRRKCISIHTCLDVT